MPMEKVECAGGIVVNPNGLVAIITNQKGKTTLPKGTHKEGDDWPEGTAKREIWEETGLTQFTVVSYLGTLVREGFTAENATTPSRTKHIEMFHCTTEWSGELTPKADDVERAFWVPPDELAVVLWWPEELAFFEAHRGDLGL